MGTPASDFLLYLLVCSLRSRFEYMYKNQFYHNYINNVANWYFQDGIHQSRDILSWQVFMLRWIFLLFPYSMLFFLFAYRSGLSQIYMVKTCRRSSSIVLLQTVFAMSLYEWKSHRIYFVWVKLWFIFKDSLFKLLKIFNLLRDSWMCFVGISNSFIYNDVTQMFRRHCYFTLNLIMRSLPKKLYQWVF